MRVATYNLRSCLGMDGRRDIARIARIIRDNGFDIVCLQEIDDRLPRSGFRSQPRELEAATGLRLIFQRTIDLRLAGFGIAIGARYPVEEIRRHSLPSRGEPRGFVEVRLAGPDGPLHVLCTHLGLSPDERVLQVDAVANRVRELGGSVILGGDFNETADGRAVRQLVAETRLSESWPDGPPTYPANAPAARIDMIFHGGALRVAGTSVIGTEASDHIPVVVDFQPIKL